MHITILEPDNFSQAALAALRAMGTVTLVDETNRAEALKRSSVLFVRLAHQIDEEFLRKTPSLRVICSPTTGHTHLNVAALKQRRVALLSLQGESEFLSEIHATPEHAFGLMLALVRHYRFAIQTPSNAHWDRDGCRGEELFGMPVGIIGYGRVGRRLASYLDAFGAKVGFCDVADMQAPGHHRRFTSISDLLKASRMIVLAASYTDQAPPIIGQRELSAMNGKYFVNIARGELVDEKCLLSLIADGHFAGAAIDVISDETNPARRKVWHQMAARRDVILTPHIAGATINSMAATESFIVEKLVRFLGSKNQGI